MLRDHRLQFGLATAMIVTLGVAILCASPRVFVAGVRSLFQKKVVLSDSSWKYEATVEIAGGVTVLESQFTWNGKPVPAKLHVNGVTIKTPIGSFSPLGRQWYPHHTEPDWWSDQYRVPANQNAGPWVQQIDHDYEISEIVANGLYETPVDGIQSLSAWSDQQLKGTPTDWVHVSKQNANSNLGYWVDPARIDKLGFD